MSGPFERLRDFIVRHMRMSHVYQPVMLRRLLTSGGKATRTDIARDILNRDPTQLEYYEQIVTGMVGKVLTSKDGLVRRARSEYELVDGKELTEAERDELIALCDGKIEEYEQRRGQRMWEHRRRTGRVISGSLRYEVLKRARYRCELCGVSAEVKALEVDHILPRNHGGKDDITNLQALCYTCNASKRDRDSTDFRGSAAMYAHREAGCIFCDMPPDRLVAENELAVAIRDGFPVTPLHTLILPKRHVADYFGLTQPEVNAIHQLLHEQRAAISREDQAVSAFNIGMNCGEVAGQTIFHCHVHLIPRRLGDVKAPRGGVRHVIPEKGAYNPT